MIDEQNNLFDFSVSAASHVQAMLLTIEDERIYVLYGIHVRKNANTVQRTFVRLSNKGLYDFKVFLLTTLTYATNYLDIPSVSDVSELFKMHLEKKFETRGLPLYII